MRISIFTPTYNRSYIIDRLYQSLRKQNFHDFEWIVIDDGSTDGTNVLFEQYSKEDNLFDIIYVKQKNGGKHRAINKGVELARGELFYIVDSDDYLPNDALEIIDDIEKSIPDNEKHRFCGVCGIKSFNSKKDIGTSFEGDYLDITMLEREENGITGDKSEVFYTQLLKKYPFPEFENENFITECVVWDKIAYDGYVLRFFNKTTMVCEYLPDGLSNHSKDLFKKNPKGYGLYLYQSSKFGKIKGLKKWKAYTEYYHMFNTKYSFAQIARNLKYPVVCLWMRFLGIKLFYKLYDRW